MQLFYLKINLQLMDIKGLGVTFDSLLSRIFISSSFTRPFMAACLKFKLKLASKQEFLLPSLSIIYLRFLGKACLGTLNEVAYRRNETLISN